MLWIGLGTWLRFHNLTDKPPWTDEFATLVFSLGNDFSGIPLGTVISADTLLQPLQPNPEASVGLVAHLLLNQDNHPPLYFVLAHLWLGLFPAPDGYLNLWAARALPALFGVATIPLSYGLMRWLGVSMVIAQGSALWMALSPYAIFISQEARHYTLAVLWVMLSLGCCLKAAQFLARGQAVPGAIAIAWGVVNAVALSVHFFTALIFLAQALSLIYLYLSRSKPQPKVWLSLLPAVLVTASAIAVWGWVISQPQFGHGMTDWIRLGGNVSSWIGPPFQLLAAWITMLCLFPVESPFLAIVILSGLAMLIYFVWLLPLLARGLSPWRSKGLEMEFLGAVMVSLTAIYLMVTYVGGMDITRGARYSFNFLPVIVWLAAFGLGPRATEPSQGWWQRSRSWPLNVLLILSAGILSGLTVTHNLGYQKYYRPDLFLVIVAETPRQGQTIIVSPHQSLVQVGEMMGLAWQERQIQPGLDNLNFALIPYHPADPGAAMGQLQRLLASQTEPLDLWLVNFPKPKSFPFCGQEAVLPKYVNGYGYLRCQYKSPP